jgi:hypothetical protein
LSRQRSSYGDHCCVTPLYGIPVWSFDCVIDEAYSLPKGCQPFKGWQPFLATQGKPRPSSRQPLSTGLGKAGTLQVVGVANAALPTLKHATTAGSGSIAHMKVFYFTYAFALSPLSPLLCMQGGHCGRAYQQPCTLSKNLT